MHAYQVHFIDKREINSDAIIWVCVRMHNNVIIWIHTCVCVYIYIYIYIYIYGNTILWIDIFIYVYI